MKLFSMTHLWVIFCTAVLLVLIDNIHPIRMLDVVLTYGVFLANVRSQTLERKGS